MTRSRKHKHRPQHSEFVDQEMDENHADTSTSADISYAPPPGPPPEASSADVADPVLIHPQGTQASFLRIASSSSQRSTLVAAGAGAEPDEQFMNVQDYSTFAAPSSASSLDLPVSHGPRGSSESRPHSAASDTSQAALPRIAVHASTGRDMHGSTSQQSFTISAGRRHQKLYYLWSPKHKHEDAAAAPGPSYVDALDNGKRKLLKQGSSPFADVTKQHVARMATFLPDPEDDRHSRKHTRPWWVSLLSPWQKPSGDAEAVGQGAPDSPHGDDKSAELAVPSWRWKLVVFLCCLVAMICYVDRAAMSVAIIPMGQEYGWSNSVKGAINRYASLRQSCHPVTLA